MLCFRDTRLCRARTVVITCCHHGIKSGYWRGSLPASVVLDALTGSCHSADCNIVLDARLPRTLAGLLAGGALGLAGALMQTLTRNPLADPGILGVNSGASFAIVLGPRCSVSPPRKSNC